MVPQVGTGQLTRSELRWGHGLTGQRCPRWEGGVLTGRTPAEVTGQDDRGRRVSGGGWGDRSGQLFPSLPVGAGEDDRGGDPDREMERGLQEWVSGTVA